MHFKGRIRKVHFKGRPFAFEGCWLRTKTCDSVCAVERKHERDLEGLGFSIGAFSIAAVFEGRRKHKRGVLPS